MRDLMVGNAQLAPVVQARASAHISTLFLDEHPLYKLANGKFAHVPVLLGVTRNIGSYLLDMGNYVAQFTLYYFLISILFNHTFGVLR